MQILFGLIFCHSKKRQEVKPEVPLAWSSLLVFLFCLFLCFVFCFFFCMCVWRYCICSLKKWKRRMDQMWDSFYSYSVCAEFKQMVPLFAVFWENILSSFCSARILVEIGLERYFKVSSCPSYRLKADSCSMHDKFKYNNNFFLFFHKITAIESKRLRNKLATCHKTATGFNTVLQASMVAAC